MHDGFPLRGFDPVPRAQNCFSTWTLSRPGFWRWRTHGTGRKNMKTSKKAAGKWVYHEKGEKNGRLTCVAIDYGHRQGKEL